MKTIDSTSIIPASFGSISHGTLRTQDLLSAFLGELEWQLRRNGDYFSRPENFGERDRLNNLVGEAQDCFAEDGEEINPEKEDDAEYLVNETLPDALQSFCAPYCCFGSHPGDGSDFGFWPDIETAKECVGFVSRDRHSWDETCFIDDDGHKNPEYPAADFQGEWLHINERGNCTLYFRDESGSDVEIWSVV